ncbi:CBWD5 [Symbiodinium sp. CCMP2456]|nr:CBWD5 [Symbiodinium sp. CCMP2456]
MTTIMGPFLEEYKDTAQEHAFVSMDGSAFALEVHNFLKIGTSVFEVNAEGRIRTIRTWLASFKDDQDDLWADGMTNLRNISGPPNGGPDSINGTTLLQKPTLVSAILQVLGGGPTTCRLAETNVGFRLVAMERNDVLDGKP